jgi:hypothetical protein
VAGACYRGDAFLNLAPPHEGGHFSFGRLMPVREFNLNSWEGPGPPTPAKPGDLLWEVSAMPWAIALG